MAGAAVAGGVAVGAVAGPMLGIAAAGGAAYAATRNDKVGDVAKSTGRAAVAVGNKAVCTPLSTAPLRLYHHDPCGAFPFLRQVELNQEHGITQKIGSGLSRATNAVKEFDRSHDVSGKVTSGLHKAGSSLQDFDRKHDVSGKVSSGITTAMNGITRALQSNPPPPPPPPPAGHQGMYRPPSQS